MCKELPHYARPLFMRIHTETPDEHTTGTFKLKKTDLVKQGWDPELVSEPLYMDDPDAGAYVPLTPELRAAMLSGEKRV
jgi:fatty-acyl-CoA synthase